MSEEIELINLDTNKEDKEDVTNFGGDDFDLRKKLFSNTDRYLQARNIAFLNNDALLLEKECNDPKFIGFHIEKRIDGLLTNFKFSHQSIENQNNFEECRTEIREYYNKWG